MFLNQMTHVVLNKNPYGFERISDWANNDRIYIWTFTVHTF